MRHASHLPVAYPPLLAGPGDSCPTRHELFVRPSTYQVAREAYTTEGVSVFFKGLGVCSARAFLVNAVQWAVSFSYIDCVSYTFTNHTSNDTGLRMDDEETASSLTPCYLVCRRSWAAIQ